MTYVPFDATPEEANAWTVLRPGVPATMRPAIVSWLWSGLPKNGNYVYPSVFHTWSNALDITFGLKPEYDGLITEIEARTLLMEVSDQQLLRLVDYQLFKSSRGLKMSGLSEILANGRSKYHVVRRDDAWRLAVRVPEGVQAAAESVIASSSSAGDLLARAWNSVYELEPNDSAAYAYAVRAVETASFSALGIRTDTATLGNSIRAIEKAEARWRLPFLREHSQYPSKDLLLGTLKSLYKGQRDRHGSEAYSDVTHEEAEGAVLLAVTLVGWFDRGLVVERDPRAFH